MRAQATASGVQAYDLLFASTFGSLKRAFERVSLRTNSEVWQLFEGSEAGLQSVSGIRSVHCEEVKLKVWRIIERVAG